MTTSPASGALPADIPEIMAMVYEYADAFHDRCEADREDTAALKATQFSIAKRIREALAALASREASSATLTDERIAALWVEHGLDEDDPEGFARIIEREVRAALASPQVAPAPVLSVKRSEWEALSPEAQDKLLKITGAGSRDLARAQAAAEIASKPLCTQPPAGWTCSRGAGHDGPCASSPIAAPVQVAPADWKLVPVEPTEAMFTRFAQQIETGVVYVGGFVQAYRCMLDAAPAGPMQPGAAADDARDAAKWRKVAEYAEKHRVNLLHLYQEIESSLPSEPEGEAANG